MKLYFVFDGPPGPEPGRFVETETEEGRSTKSGGTWAEYPGKPGLWRLGPLEVITEDEAAEFTLLRRNNDNDTPGPWIQRAFDALGTAKANAARVEELEQAARKVIDPPSGTSVADNLQAMVAVLRRTSQ